MSDLSSFICSDELRLNVKANLSKFEAVMEDDDSLRRAAVAIVVTDVGPGADNGLQDKEDGLIKRLLFLLVSQKNLEPSGSMGLARRKMDAEKFITCAERAGRRGRCLAWYKSCSRLFRRLCHGSVLRLLQWSFGAGLVRNYYQSAGSR